MSDPHWAPIPGFELLYCVNGDGEVLSLGRTAIGGSRGGTCVKHYKRKYLKIQIRGENGHDHAPCVALTPAQVNGVKRPPVRHYIYDLVRNAFGKEAADALPKEFHHRPCGLYRGRPVAKPI